MPGKEEAKNEIQSLIDKYKRISESGRVNTYKEEQTKKDFILPLFRALGWQVEDGDEVGAEEKVSKGRVDYAFNLNGIPRFFVEAKAMKEDLERPEYAKQAINYSWLKGVIWAILTDFEGIKVFNAEVKWQRLQESLLFEMKWDQFLERFDQLWLLSKESVSNGTLDKEAEKWNKKIRKQPIDKQLL
jgi:hypothetical protein